jgi:CubicO group peptidase (beta-lactamase class C family)
MRGERKKDMSRLMMKLIIAAALVSSVIGYPIEGAAWAANTALPAQAATSGPTDPKEMGAFIDGIMADQMDSNHIPGAVVSVVKDGKLVFTKGYGYSDYENKVPVDAERTLFRVGSVSKLFVWTAVMQLVEQGKLSLDADINTYLDFKIPTTYPQPITMKNLMSHTAGFEDNGYKMYRLQPEELIPLSQYVKTRIPDRVYPPGKIAAYSNYGASLAGYIVERISGLPFTEYTEKTIFSPLGMAHSSFRQPLPANLAPDMSYEYNFYQEQYLKCGFEYVRDYPAGGMTSTAADMAQFMLVHLQNGQLGSERILSEKAALQMHSQLFSPDPRLPGMAYGFMEKSLNGQRLLWHGGDTTFFSSGLYLLPDQNLGLFVATNAPGGNIARDMLIQKIMDRYYPAVPETVPPTQASRPAADFANRMAPFAGTYIASRNNYTTPAKVMAAIQSYSISLNGDSLTFSLPGKTFHLVEIEPGLMRDRDNPNFKVALHTDETGQAYLLFPGPNFAFIKVPWYENLIFISLMIVIAAGLFSYMITDWVKGAIAGLRKRQSPSIPPGNATLSRLARLAAALFGVLLFIGVACLQIGLSTIDPNLGVPVFTFGEPPLINLLPILAYLLAGLGALMLIFIPLAWIRRLWSLRYRLYYSLLTLSALSMLWVFWFWNLHILLT